MATERRRAEHLLLPLLVAAVAVGAFLWNVRSESQTASVRVHYEDLALVIVRKLADAEHAFHERTGRYGWLGELQQADLLADVAVAREDGELGVVAERYRIDILLPHAVTAGDLVRIAPRKAGYDDPDLQRRHFAVVARPWGDELTGFRTYYLDEVGNVYVSEGVSNVPSRALRPLPDLHMSYGRYPNSWLPSEVAGLRFWPLEHMPKR